MTIDHAWQKVIGAHAAHIRYRDEFAKAYRTLEKFPCYTIRGAANHHKLNDDIFQKEHEGSPADAMAAKRLQSDELFTTVSQEAA